MILVGALGTGVDLRGLVRERVGVVERNWSSSSTRSVAWLVRFDTWAEGREEVTKGKKWEREFGQESMARREGRGGEREEGMRI